MADDNQNFTEKEKTDPFFIAKEFSWTHFLRPLIECRRMIKIAKYGYEDISEKYQLSEQQIVINKIEALNRLIDELELLCRDCEFKMSKDNWKVVEGLLERIESVKKVIDAISYGTTDQRTQHSQVQINFEHFNNCLFELIDIDAKIKIPLNNEYIIYPKGDSFDFEDWSKDFVEGGG